MATENLKTITVRGHNAADAVAEAALHLEGRGYKITGDPVRTSVFAAARVGPKVWLWRVPIEHEEAPAYSPPNSAVSYNGDYPDGEEPTCDLCGRAQDDAPARGSDEWNGNTGNHVACEAIDPQRQVEDIRSNLFDRDLSDPIIADRVRRIIGVVD